MQASLIVAIVAGAFLSEQFTTPFWMIGALATGGLAPACRAAATVRASTPLSAAAAPG